MTAPYTTVAALSDKGAAPLDQHLEWLDRVLADRDRYVRLLRQLMGVVRTNALVQYTRRGRALIVGAFYDDTGVNLHTGTVLAEHAKANGRMIDLMAAVEADGLVIEERHGDLRALALTIKRYLHMGGILFIDQDGELQTNEGMPAEWCKRGPNALAIENTFRAWMTIRRLPNMEVWAKRFVRMAGYRRDGFIILEKRS